jgi:hypothetical protein
MGQEITITINIATTLEGKVATTILSTGNEEYQMKVPSVEMPTDSLEGEISVPSACGQPEETFDADIAPPEIEAIAGMFEGEISDPPTNEHMNEAMQDDVPPPKIDPIVDMDESDVPAVPTDDEIYEVDKAVMPVPETGKEVPFEVFEDPVDADVPPIPTI